MNLAAIFPFLHNGRQFPFDMRRSADPNFGGLVIWSFSVGPIVMN